MPSEAPLPTDAEFRILDVLWDGGAQTVRDVHEHLSRGRDLQYTTVLRLLQNMHAKGLVTRDEAARSHVYRAAVERDWATGEFVADLTSRVFEGSTARLVIRALGRHPAPKEELEQIRAYLDTLDEE